MSSCVVFLTCILSWSCTLAEDVGKLSIAHGPYLQAVTEASATVVWFTNKDCVSRVEYGPADGGATKTAFASHHGLIDANTRLHRIPLTGLVPGRTYRYRVVSREITRFDPYQVTFGETVTAGPYRVRTWDPAQEEFSFCVINDIHEKIDRLNSVLDLVPWDRTDMVFLNGDMIDHWSRENQVFDGFLDVCVSRFAKETPFLYVRGNHETRGALARGLLDYFPTPNGRYYCAFRHGPVAFLILDAGEDKPDSNKEYSGLVDFDAYRAEQTEWLRAAVREDSFRNARYRIVVMHMPPFPDPKSYGLWEAHRRWSPILNRADIHLMICGHIHRFSRIEPMEWANFYPILVNGLDMAVIADVSSTRLDVTVRKADGEVVDTLLLKPHTAD